MHNQGKEHAYRRAVVSAISSAPKEHSTDDTFPAASRADAKSNTCTVVVVIVIYFSKLPCVPGLSIGLGSKDRLELSIGN
jgi:hypothetical protein